MADNRTGRRAPRDYTLDMIGGTGDTAPFTAATSAGGDFFYVRGVTIGGGSIYDTLVDMYVEVLFDDTDKLIMRAGEWTKREFSSVSVRPLMRSGVLMSTSRLRYVAGYGEYHAPRNERKSPEIINTHQETVGTLDAALVTTGIMNVLARGEVRLCIPESEANGLYIGSDNTVDDTSGIWLPKGVIEWFSFSGELWAYNAGGSNVIITVGAIGQSI